MQLVRGRAASGSWRSVGPTSTPASVPDPQTMSSKPTLSTRPAPPTLHFSAPKFTVSPPQPCSIPLTDTPQPHNQAPQRATAGAQTDAALVLLAPRPPARPRPLSSVNVPRDIDVGQLAEIWGVEGVNTVSRVLSESKFQPYSSFYEESGPPTKAPPPAQIATQSVVDGFSCTESWAAPLLPRCTQQLPEQTHDDLDCGVEELSVVQQQVARQSPDLLLSPSPDAPSFEEAERAIDCFLESVQAGNQSATRTLDLLEAALAETLRFEDL